MNRFEQAPAELCQRQVKLGWLTRWGKVTFGEAPFFPHNAIFGGTQFEKLFKGLETLHMTSDSGAGNFRS